MPSTCKTCGADEENCYLFPVNHLLLCRKCPITLEQVKKAAEEAAECVQAVFGGDAHLDLDWLPSKLELGYLDSFDEKHRKHRLEQIDEKLGYMACAVNELKTFAYRYKGDKKRIVDDIAHKYHVCANELLADWDKYNNPEEDDE